MPRRNLYIVLAITMVALACYHEASWMRSRYGAEFTAFCRVMDEIEKNYYYFDPADKEELAQRRRKLYEAGMAGIVESLDDPYSLYFPPKKSEELHDELAQKFGGIGVNVAWDTDHKTLKVASPLVGTPAHKAGLAPGDLILKVDGEPLQGKSMGDAVSLIKGDPDTDVRLTVQRGDEEQPREFVITRDIINVPSVLGDRYLDDGAWEYHLEGESGIAYIRLVKFGEKSVDELREVLADLATPSLKGVVLDLRGNPGGLLSSAVEVCDLFLDKGRVVSTRDRDGVTRSVYEAKRGGFTEVPLAVLVDGYSASASEIVSACLQDHHRAVIVGERTYGKGSVQDVIKLEGRKPGGSSLKLTIATYWRPSGKNIHRLPNSTEEDEWGVSPDDGYLVELSKDEETKMREHRRARDVYHTDGQSSPPLDIDLDPQLKKAVEYLKLGATRRAAAA